MALRLSMAVRCASPERAARLQKMLARESRPVFEDDIDDPADRELFLVIEDLEYPQQLHVSGSDLIGHWFEADGLSFDDLGPLLSDNNVELLAVYEIPDDPMSLDGDEDAWFWLPDGKHCRQVSIELAESVLPRNLVEIVRA